MKNGLVSDEFMKFRIRIHRRKGMKHNKGTHKNKDGVRNEQRHSFTECLNTEVGSDEDFRNWLI